MLHAHRGPALATLCLLALAWVPGAHAAPPTYDDIASPLSLPATGASLSLDMSEATAAVDDPGCGTPVYQSVWLSFVSPVDQYLRFDILSSTGVRPRLSVWTGEPGALAAQDCHPDAHAAGVQAVAGTEYLVMVSSPADGGVERASLSVSPHSVTNPTSPIPPANDFFWYAQPIAALPFALTTDMGAARGDSGYDPRYCNDPQATSRLGDTLWYTLQVSQAQEVDALFASDTGSPYVGVFTGDLDNLELVACSFEGESRRGATRFLAQPGQLYRVEFASGTEAVNSRIVDIAVRPSPPPLGGSIEVTPLVSTFVTRDWIDPIFVPDRHLVVRGFVFCDAPLAQLTVELTVTQGQRVASDSATAACVGGVGSYRVEMDRVDQGFRIGPASVTARAWEFDSHFDTPQVSVPVWVRFGVL
ncbi:hypothetical protein E4634_03860 [Mangrovimicrobium sediminis]|uniref:Uncharacterized protein n=1 Tax=Mangrovimicrobium sediminis TaxID=2562682 RepID=A0A4Z0M6W2_9GAMM|nr:hypothetical protein [Haliea sp. SAOS-164]TGD75148.1 hypothetical protein E4634_03860 [Haliea sp. SAOS-164]